MLQGAASFRGDLSKWDVSSVTDMSGMEIYPIYIMASPTSL